MYKFRYLYIVLTAVFLMISCSTKKNTTVNRAYHNLTAHYNVFFNARETFNAGRKEVYDNIPEDFNTKFPVVKATKNEVPTVMEAPTEIVLTKCNKLIAKHSITKKPKRKKGPKSPRYRKFERKGEWNNWVDDAYLYIGKSFFYRHEYYRAQAAFEMVTRRFKQGSVYYDSWIWQAETLIQLDREEEAKEILLSMESDFKFPQKFKPHLKMIWADYHLHNNDIDNAIIYLTRAINDKIEKRQKVRLIYLLAQIYQERGDKGNAMKFYDKVGHTTNYPIAFNAKLNELILSVDQVGVQPIVTKMKRLSREPRNFNFRDRIFYCMGELYWENTQYDNAIASYRLSAEYASTDQNQRLISCLKLARIYFDREDYHNSKAYYDSTMLVIPLTHDDYDQIAERSKNLGELITNLDRVEREDSLQRIANMSEEERNAYVDLQIKKEKDRIEEEKKRAEQEQYVSNYGFQNNTNSIVSNNQEVKFYFYNPTTVGIGEGEFKRLWGRRELEDDWRRKSKVSIKFDNQDTDLLADDEVAEVDSTKTSDKLNKNFYLQDVPMTDSMMQASHIVIQNSLLTAARIYRSDLNDLPKSKETFEELLRRYPKTEYRSVALFAIYDLCRSMHLSSEQENIKQQIVREYPNSMYAKFLKDPQAFYAKNNIQDSINTLYEKAFRHYRKSEWNRAIALSQQALDMKPDSTMLPKVAFVNTVAKGVKMSNGEFSDRIYRYLEKFPEEEPSPIAERILLLLKDNSLNNYDALVASGYLNDQIVNIELLNADAMKEFGGKFTLDPHDSYYYVLVFDKKDTVNVNRLIFEVAHFNIDYYPQLDYDIDVVDLNGTTKMLVVRTTPNMEEGLIYLYSVVRRREIFFPLRYFNYVNFIVSAPNYRAMLADKDFREYHRFFLKFISPFQGKVTFPEERLPDTEHLLVKKPVATEAITDSLRNSTLVKQEREKPKYEWEFKEDLNKPHYFVLIGLKSRANASQIVKRIETFHKEYFKDKGLTVSVENIDASRFAVIVKGIGEQESALAYAQAIVQNREIYKPFKGSSYRNFAITEENYKIFRKTNNARLYTNFYRFYYLKK